MVPRSPLLINQSSFFSSPTFSSVCSTPMAALCQGSWPLTAVAMCDVVIYHYSNQLRST